MHDTPARSIGSFPRVLISLILVAYAAARLLEIVPNSMPRLGIVALDVLSALAFALVDGYRHFRRRSVLVFIALCLVVG